MLFSVEVGRLEQIKGKYRWTGPATPPDEARFHDVLIGWYGYVTPVVGRSSFAGLPVR